MDLNNNESVWAECEKLGEPAVQARLVNGDFGEHSTLPQQWLLECQAERRAAKEAEDNERNKRALAASEASARASETAAEASRQSARWTMWAAIAAFLSVIIPAITQCASK